MALVIPNSTITTVGDDHAAETTVSNHDILVRDGVYLSASGSGARAIKMGAEGLATIDGYIYSQRSYTLESYTGSTVLVGEEGVISGGSGFAAVWLKDQSLLTVKGMIGATGSAVNAGLDSVITVSGSITAQGSGVIMDGGSLLTNTGEISSGNIGIHLTAGGPTGNAARSTVSNSGTVTSGASAVYIGKDNTSIDNSGTLSSTATAIIAAFDDHNHIISNSGKIIAGEKGILLSGDNHLIDNSGTISADDVALDFSNGGGMTVTNSGTILSQTTDAIQFNEAGAQLINTGIIAGNFRGIFANSNGANSVTAVSDKVIINHGTISGETSTGIVMMGVDNRVTNTGAVNGAQDGIELDGSGTIANTATGTITARAGNGIDVFQGAAGGRTVIENAGTIQSEDARGIEVNASGAVVRNSGAIASDDTGIYVLNDGNRVVNSGAVTTGDEGIWANYSGTTIVNSGDITVETQAVRVSGNGTGEALVRNSGSIVADSFYTVYLTTLANDADLYNSGEILSADGGAVFMGGSGDNLLRNTGEIVGETFSLLGSTGAETLRNLGTMDGTVDIGSGDDAVVNAGSIAGDVVLGAGNDSYRGKGAGSVTGTVEGGTGDDQLRGSSADDVLNGGTDLDSVYGRGGDDHVMGGNQRDHVFGNAGDDRVDGGGGADVINGGRGDDVLIGGGGADAFVIIRAAENDTILDFKDGVDVIDLTAFGLVPADFASVVAPALSDAGGGATFLDLDAMGGTGSVLIHGLAFASAGAGDFVL